MGAALNVEGVKGVGVVEVDPADIEAFEYFVAGTHGIDAFADSIDRGDAQCTRAPRAVCLGKRAVKAVCRFRTLCAFEKYA